MLYWVAARFPNAIEILLMSVSENVHFRIEVCFWHKILFATDPYFGDLSEFAEEFINHPS